MSTYRHENAPYERSLFDGSIRIAIGLFISGFALIVAASEGAREVMQEHAFQIRRAEALGEILKCEDNLVAPKTTRSGEEHRPEVIVAFTRDGVDYRSTRIDRKGATGSREWSQERLGRYRVGDRVTVYFDSQNPNDACLDPLTPFSIYLMPFLTCGAATFFAAVWPVARRGTFRLVGVGWIAVASASLAHYVWLTDFRPTTASLFVGLAGIAVGLFITWKANWFARRFGHPTSRKLSDDIERAIGRLREV